MIEKHRSVAGDLAVAGSIGGRASAIRRTSSLSVAGRRRSAEAMIGDDACPRAGALQTPIGLPNVATKTLLRELHAIVESIVMSTS